MEPAPDIESFVRAPLGRYVHGKGWLCFYATPHLSGISVWGDVVASEVDAAMVIPPDIHRFGKSPRAGLIDARRVEEVEPEAFQVAARYVMQHQDTIASLLSRVAILHRPGLMSSVAAGFFSMADPAYLVRSFTESDEAFRWLEIPDGEAVLAEVDRIRARVDEASFHRELRALVARALQDPEPTSTLTLVACAKTLGLSSRSLQRRLGERGSSFRRELAAARVARAQELLATTTLSVGEVAFQVGCASEQHFSRLFRRLTAESPARWRKKRGAP
ncbi:MAG TPA: helix-turn-helix transcriptional regulator [Polyangia bacterium]|nr:helix-turn-helix transcriptional regulator [Polyangia bacterium]